MKIWTTLIASILCFYLQAQSLEEGIKYSQEGNFEKAEDSFSALSNTNARHTYSYTIARAYNYSWWGKFDLADTLFREAISKDKDNIEGYLGMAHNLAWSDERAQAVHYFKKAIQLEPFSKSAWFGMAFNYLEKGNVEGARSTLNEMQKFASEEAEFYLLKGLVAIQDLDHDEAKKSFEKALSKNPTLKLAEEKLAQFEAIPVKLALTLWHGSTIQSKAAVHSLRRVDLVFIPNTTLMFYAGYDNTLVMQNVFLRTNEMRAPMFFLGGKYNMSDNFFTKLEIGRRTFNQQPDQTLLHLENTFFLNQKLILSSLIFYNNRKNEPLLTVGANADFGLLPKFRTSIAYFYNSVLTNTVIKSHRILISSKLFVQKSEVNLGFFVDKYALSEDANNYGGGYFSLLSFPIISNLDGRILFQKDINISEDNNALLSLGIKIKL